ncbi:hypothetical protein D3C72_1630560 [compost metagenome]
MQQGIDMFRPQQQAAFLGTDQAIFHDMGDADPGIDANNPRCALERMSRAHAGFQLIGLGRIALQCQQAGTEHLGLGLGLQAEQFEQRSIAHLLWGHERLRFTADSTCSSSSTRTLRPRHCSTAAVKRVSPLSCTRRSGSRP